MLAVRRVEWMNQFNFRCGEIMIENTMSIAKYNGYKQGWKVIYEFNKQDVR